MSKWLSLTMAIVVSIASTVIAVKLSGTFEKGVDLFNVLGCGVWIGLTGFIGACIGIALEEAIDRRKEKKEKEKEHIETIQRMIGIIPDERERED